MTRSAEIFKTASTDRLRQFLSDKFGENFGQVKLLTPDASQREYFRIKWETATAIACVYPEPFAPDKQSYLDVTNLFAGAGLPVAEIYDFSPQFGIIVHEDFGDKILRGVLAGSSDEEKESLLNQAIGLIAEIQTATARAFELNSIAARLAFDREKLGWELDFFVQHYFETYRGEKLPEADAANLTTELNLVASELAARPRILTHRDFHAANLMIDGEERLRIIDHQDARMGTASYDLVSILLDRILEPPARAWITTKQQFFLSERERLGLPKIAAAEFAEEFNLQTIQRCLKAIGTFSFQTAVRGKTNYAQYISPMFRVVTEAAAALNRFPVLQQIIEKQIK